MPTYTFPTNISVGDIGQVTWANGVSAALNELGPLVDTKANDDSVVKLTGNQTVAGTKTFSSAPSVPDNSFPIAKTSGLQSALDSKQNAPTTGTPSASTYLRGDGSWTTPTNTTYTAISDAEATAGTSTTSRTVTAASLKRDIPKYAVAKLNGVNGLWKGTQAEYDAITTKDASVIYVITS